MNYSSNASNASGTETVRACTLSTNNRTSVALKKALSQATSSPVDVMQFISTSHRGVSQSIKIASNEMSSLEIQLNEYEAQAEQREQIMFQRIQNSRINGDYSCSLDSAQLGRLRGPHDETLRQSSEFRYPGQVRESKIPAKGGMYQTEHSLTSIMAANFTCTPGCLVDDQGHDLDNGVFDLDM